MTTSSWDINSGANDGAGRADGSWDASDTVFNIGEGNGYVGPYPLEPGGWRGFFRFATSLAAGITISSAVLRLYAGGPSYDATEWKIYVADADAVAAPANAAELFAIPLVGGVDWDAAGTWTWNSAHDSPNFATALQQLVDRPGFSGVVMVVIVNDGGASSKARAIGTYESTVTKHRLTVTYTVPTTVSANPFDLTLDLSGTLHATILALPATEFSLSAALSGTPGASIPSTAFSAAASMSAGAPAISIPATEFILNAALTGQISYDIDWSRNRPLARLNTYAASRLTEPISRTATRAKIPTGDYGKFLGGWADGGCLYCAIRSPVAREIVRVDIGESNIFDGLKIDRGEDGDAAAAWPAGSLIYQVLSAAHLDMLMQSGNERQVAYNPNGVLSPLYFGEKVYQTDIAVWWISMAATGTAWRPIAGALQVATPTISPPAGTYANGQTVTIECATPSTTIYYTIDGSDVEIPQ